MRVALSLCIRTSHVSPFHRRQISVFFWGVVCVLVCLVGVLGVGFGFGVFVVSCCCFCFSRASRSH